MVNNVGLSTSLSALVEALQANQTTLSYLSENIGNVNTTGYTARVVSQEPEVSAGSGVGVDVTQITRAIDTFLQNAVRTQLGTTAQSTVTNTYLSRLQSDSFGDPSSGSTINNSLSTFYSDLQTFSDDPSNGVNGSLVINSASAFTSSVNNLAQSIENERINADSDISSNISNLNSILSNLSTINTALVQAKTVGGDDLNSLEDARDLQLNNLNSIVSTDDTFNQYGAVSINIGGAQILSPTQQYKVDYTPVPSVSNLINGAPTGAITVSAIDENGSEIGDPFTLLSASNATTKINNLTAGNLSALVALRDTTLPATLNQLNTFASAYANSFNAAYNSGTGFPPPSSLTGTQAFTLNDTREFSGQTRITLTDANGQPVTGGSGQPIIPLLIDFNNFNGGSGFGTASVQSIINEINDYYGAQPAQTVNIGSANDIRVASTSSNITSADADGTISFSGNPSDGDTLDINGTTIRFKTTPALSTDVKLGTTVAATLANLKAYLNSSNDANISQANYTVSGSTLTITNKISGTAGDAFTLDASGTGVATASGVTLANGANASGNFNFDFDFSNLSPDGNPVTFNVTQLSVNGGAENPVTFTPYTQAAGNRSGTDQAGSTNDSLSVAIPPGLGQGDSFTVTATVQVTEAGVTKSDNVTYTVQIPAPDTDIQNNTYAATAVSGTGDGTLVAATSTAPYMTASLVDANGNPITDPNTPGYLKIATANGDYGISIDQLNSADEGNADTPIPAATATGEGFSQFFGLNNFFDYGGSTTNAALNLQVRSDIMANPNLLASGKAEQTAATGTDNVYTYELGVGNNASVLDQLQTQNAEIGFAAAGGLPKMSTTADSYATDIYSYSANQANDAQTQSTQDTALQTSLQTQFNNVSGVNLDEQMAQTIEVQNSYAAAAQVLGIVRDLFSTLENVFSSVTG